MTMETIIQRPEGSEESSPDVIEKSDTVSEGSTDITVKSDTHSSNDDELVRDHSDEQQMKNLAEAKPLAETPDSISELQNDDVDSEIAEEGDFPAVNGNEDEMDAGLEDLPINAALHAADEMKKRLEELDPCEKLRALCKKGEVEELEKFLEKKEQIPVDIDYISSDGWTCLHEIITHGCQFTAVAKVLLQHGAKVDTTDFNLDTPLHASLLYHNTDNTKLLLEHGANLELANAKGRKPIHNANDTESLELLLNHGALVDAKDGNGNTSLHYAVMAKDVDRVKLLVQRKCDIKSTNNSGSTALHLASDPEIARILLESIDPEELDNTVNLADNAGNSPLHVAVRGRHRDTVRLLVGKNGKHDVLNTSGKSPMSLAKDKEMKNILLKKETSRPGSPANLTNIKKVKTAPATPEGPIILPGNQSLQSPSILKRKKKHETDERTGTRLRFSEVVDYSGVEEEAPVSKRVRVTPLYTEHQFSSDDEEWVP